MTVGAERRRARGGDQSHVQTGAERAGELAQRVHPETVPAVLVTVERGRAGSHVPRQGRQGPPPLLAEAADLVPQRGRGKIGLIIHDNKDRSGGPARQ